MTPDTFSVKSPAVQVRQSNQYLVLDGQGAVGQGTRQEYRVSRKKKVGSALQDLGGPAVMVRLTSSDPTKLQVLSQVVIPAGAISALFTVTGTTLTGEESPVTVTASADGYPLYPGRALQVRVEKARLLFHGLERRRSTDEAIRDNFQVCLLPPSGSYTRCPDPGIVHAASNLAVDLSLVEEDPPTTTLSFYESAAGGQPVRRLVIPVGGHSVEGYAGVASEQGEYKIRATATGIEATRSRAIHASSELPFLSFDSDYSHFSGLVGKRLWRREGLILKRERLFSPYSPDEAVTVSLRSSDPEKVRVPGTATIPAGKSRVYVPVQGIALTEATGEEEATWVSIVQAPSGYSYSYEDGTQFPYYISVVQGYLELLGPYTRSRAVPQRDRMEIYVSNPRVINAHGPTRIGSGALAEAAVDISVDLSLVDTEPAHQVSFYETVTGGQPTSQLTIPSGQESVVFYVDTPSSAGSYTVRAEAEDLVASYDMSVEVVDDPIVSTFSFSSAPLPWLRDSKAGCGSTFTVIIAHLSH